MQDARSATTKVQAGPNVAERFFSQAGMVLSPLRQAMAPTQLENIIFLKMNRRFWNMATVQAAGKQIRYA
ncbi:hypothetical protein PC116_g25135 [Phytophthora cactorum]|uniref:HAT C-terminal dimerisation domain-containing protein n=1 Tax=Phytophthora cactorum TaxID=29920 RepID=A0A8T1AW93_9STRA|nr:hypothetical protein Pcac1_g27870 [Phytophthora cactorum]KAG2800346.1 hypothetical protein PC112_g20528 [Phytophthora cactorum]KAG2800701.1 hypothetical protein PC111_g19864 [Phytophthora cactorum]KAG2834284.1 hypothetical protein PC113_g20419 [Phytophthora cactorum]KAG2878193.1 hypothetical protein PC114_g23254 [Phytophthora cactorum]